MRVTPRLRTLVSRPCNSAVRHGTAKCGGAVVLAGEGEAAEPARPVLVEVPVDAGARSARGHWRSSAW